MPDDSLRALEREAAHDPAARLRWAQALLRLGRRDEALAPLVARAASSEDARRALGAYPAWRARAGTAFVDVPPLTEEPRLAWVATGTWGDLLASPLAVVHVRRATSSSSTPGPAAPPGEPRALGAPGFLWRAGRGLLDPDAALATTACLLLQGGGHVELRARDAGGPLWRRPGREARGDARGVVARDAGAAVAYDLAGERRWSVPALSLAALAPDHAVLVASGAQGRADLVAVERATGRERHLVTLPPGQFWGEPAVARDVQLVPLGRALLARAPHAVFALVPGDGRSGGESAGVTRARSGGCRR